MGCEVGQCNKRDAPFHCTADDYSPTVGFCDLLRDVPWVDILKVGGSAAGTKFCEKVQVGINVYILLCNYLIKPHLSPCFSAAFAVLI